MRKNLKLCISWVFLTFYYWYSTPFLSDLFRKILHQVGQRSWAAYEKQADWVEKMQIFEAEDFIFIRWSYWVQNLETYLTSLVIIMSLRQSSFEGFDQRYLYSLSSYTSLESITELWISMAILALFDTFIV